MNQCLYFVDFPEGSLAFEIDEVETVLAEFVVDSSLEFVHM